MLVDSADPANTALPIAVGWVDHLLTGNVGTTLAILAIAVVGLRLLQGYLDPREAMRVILGCFILFGAPAIAAGLMRTAYGAQEIRAKAAPANPVPSAKPLTPPQFDPYAGAAMPGP